MKTKLIKQWSRVAGTFLLGTLLAGSARASSHMDAPLIFADPPANTTDLYAFVTQRDTNKFLTVALSVYPFQEPAIGPNRYGFDPNVLYQIHISSTNAARGQRAPGGGLATASYSYQFQFRTRQLNRQTILQSYLGVITNVHDENQNFQQNYTVTRVNHRTGQAQALGNGKVPPNNQGIATPFYNRDNNGNNPAKDGLDEYTQQSIAELGRNHRSFAGQRDDAFYGDINAIFDLLQVRSTGADSQKGFNVHTIVLEIPLAELGGGRQVVGVWATTSRRSVNVLRDARNTPFEQVRPTFRPSQTSGNWVQVGRQGNPLFAEALIAMEDKDLYNRSNPALDRGLFSKYARTPEVAALLNAIRGQTAPTDDRSDLVGIFIPDVIKVDLSTGPAKMNGDPGFHPLSVFGGDTLQSQVAGTVPGGWPNGRRFEDDVVDIGLTAINSDLRVNPPVVRAVPDGVYSNDRPIMRVFPYAPSPNNGRNHSHH